MVAQLFDKLGNLVPVLRPVLALAEPDPGGLQRPWRGTTNAQTHHHRLLYRLCHEENDAPPTPPAPPKSRPNSPVSFRAMRGPLLIAIALAAGYVYMSGNGAVSRHTTGAGQGGGAGIESYMNASGRAANGIRNAAAGFLD